MKSITIRFSCEDGIGEEHGLDIPNDLLENLDKDLIVLTLQCRDVLRSSSFMVMIASMVSKEVNKEAILNHPKNNKVLVLEDNHFKYEEPTGAITEILIERNEQPSESEIN